MSTRTEHACLGCGQRIDVETDGAADEIARAARLQPQREWCFVCGTCRTLHCLAAGGALRKLTPAEIQSCRDHYPAEMAAIDQADFDAPDVVQQLGEHGGVGAVPIFSRDVDGDGQLGVREVLLLPGTQAGQRQKT